MMNGYFQIALLLIVMATLPEGSQSACCHPTWYGCLGPGVGQACKDGTAPTPYCGYGGCNLFGCDCNGGCRRGDWTPPDYDCDDWWLKNPIMNGKISHFLFIKSNVSRESPVK